jgi:aminoglycoside phosphotransferase (APT) family kinase protein
MDIEALIRSISGTATHRRLSGTQGSTSEGSVYRLLEETGVSTILKVYAMVSRERRERHALEALAGTTGVPAILDRGNVDGTSWLLMTDAGTWSLASLPHNAEILKRAGQVLRGVHDTNANITNLEEGIGSGVDNHYRSTIERLGRFRRRLGLDQSVLDAAAEAPPPEASPSRPAHTRPTPERFLANEDGKVTLIAWEWATLAPPEWDLSLASWRLESKLGGESAAEFLEGYGYEGSAEHLQPWVAYHAAMLMLDAAENRDGRLHDLAPLGAALAEAVGAS